MADDHPGEPLLTVVIPTLEASAHVAQALASLAAQGFRDFEVLVIDGASADATLHQVELLRDRLPALSVLVGRDGGVYQAINRGLAAARGRWVLVLGSDDVLHAPDVLERVAPHLHAGEDDIVYGDVLVRGSNAYLRDGQRYAGPVDFEFLLDRNVCQQAIFYRRTLFESLGMFNPRYRICADWDFLLRAYGRARLRWLDMVVSDYSARGLSSREDDPPFDHDRPMLVLRLMAGQARNPEILGLRWRLRVKAQIQRRQGHAVRALLLLAGWAWLALASRLQPARRGAVA